jgi:hypothetical protein
VGIHALSSLISDFSQVPETKGLTLEEMDEVFSDREGLAVADQQRQNEIADRIGLSAYSQVKPSEVLEDDKENSAV